MKITKKKHTHIKRNGGKTSKIVWDFMANVQEVIIVNST